MHPAKACVEKPENYEVERLVIDPSTETAQLDRSARLLAGQNRVLRLLAEGRPLADVLSALCHALEEVMPGSACSILLLDAPNGQLRALPRNWFSMTLPIMSTRPPPRMSFTA